MFKVFIKRFKEYINYIMTVNFKELWFNVLILLGIILLSCFVFIPISLVRDFFRDFLLLFMTFNGSFMKAFNFIFLFISNLCALLCFIWLFNKRFEDMDFFKEQIKDSHVEKKVKKSVPEIELPKTKK